MLGKLSPLFSILGSLTLPHISGYMRSSCPQASYWGKINGGLLVKYLSWPTLQLPVRTQNSSVSYCPGPSILPHQTPHQWNNKRTELQGDGWGGRWTGQPRSPGLLTSLPIISLSGRSGGESRKVWVPWHVPFPGGLLQVSLSRNNCFYFLRKITETQMCIGTICNQAGWQKSWESNQLFPFR